MRERQTIRVDEAPALARTARRRRLGASALVVALLLAGSAWGHDDAFPFGPFRMFATKQRLDGATTWYATEGVTVDGSVVAIPIERFGLRRAELEGQMDRFRADPSLLGLLVDAYELHHPTEAPLVELRVVKHRQAVRAGVPHGAPTQRVVLRWNP